jgi:hypothetical protein
MTAIHPQVSTSHKAAPFRQQKYRWCLEVIRYTKFPQQRTCHPRLLYIWVRSEKFVRHCRSDIL